MFLAWACSLVPAHVEVPDLCLVLQRSLTPLEVPVLHLNPQRSPQGLLPCTCSCGDRCLRPSPDCWFRPAPAEVARFFFKARIQAGRCYVPVLPPSLPLTLNQFSPKLTSLQICASVHFKLPVLPYHTQNKSYVPTVAVKTSESHAHSY